MNPSLTRKPRNYLFFGSLFGLIFKNMVSTFENLSWAFNPYKKLKKKKLVIVLAISIFVKIINLATILVTFIKIKSK